MTRAEAERRIHELNERVSIQAAEGDIEKVFERGFDEALKLAGEIAEGLEERKEGAA